jgi:hypothetical protein
MNAFFRMRVMVFFGERCGLVTKRFDPASDPDPGRSWIWIWIRFKIRIVIRI